MKKQFLLLIAIFVFGSLVIYLPHFLSGNKNQVVNVAQTTNQGQVKEEIVQEFPGKLDKVKTDQTPKEELTIHGRNKIYFDNTDRLNQYFSASEIDYIKTKIQVYVQRYISYEILECTLIPETIKKTDKNVTFQLAMDGVKKFEVEVVKNADGQITDIIMINN